MQYCSRADDRVPHKMKKLTPSPSTEEIILSAFPSRSRSRSKSPSAFSTNSTASVNSSITPKAKTSASVTDDENVSDPEQSTRTYCKGWTAEKDRMLIEMWRDKPPLYDMNHKDHKNPDKRRATIEKFAAVLDMPYDAVSKHLRTLRTNYTRMVHMPSGSGSDGLSEKKKEQKRLMSFLRPYVSSRSSYSHVARESKTQGNLKSSRHRHSKVKAGTNAPKPSKSTEGVNPSTLTSGLPDLSDFKDGDHNPSSPKVTQTKSHTKSQADSEAVLIENVAQSLASMADAVSQRSIHTAIPQDERNNSNVLWCRLLAIKLAKLDDIEAELFKHKVDGMILDILKKKN